MLVKIDESVKVESVQLELNRIKEDYEVLFEGEQLNVTVDFKWDSHGNLVPFPSGPNGEYTLILVGVSVKITKHTYTDIIGEHEVNGESWLLDINGERINGDVYEYKCNGNKFYCECITGWG